MPINFDVSSEPDNLLDAITILMTSKQRDEVGIDHLTDMINTLSSSQRDDLASMIKVQKLIGSKNPEILFNIYHDLGGISQEKRCFIPRSEGYSKILRGMRMGYKLGYAAKSKSIRKQN
jgi:hypothetical protein